MHAGQSSANDMVVLKAFIFMIWNFWQIANDVEKDDVLLQIQLRIKKSHSHTTYV